MAPTRCPIAQTTGEGPDASACRDRPWTEWTGCEAGLQCSDADVYALCGTQCARHGPQHGDSCPSGTTRNERTDVCEDLPWSDFASCDAEKHACASNPMVAALCDTTCHVAQHPDAEAAIDAYRAKEASITSSERAWNQHCTAQVGQDDCHRVSECVLHGGVCRSKGVDEAVILKETAQTRIDAIEHARARERLQMRLDEPMPFSTARDAAFVGRVMTSLNETCLQPGGPDGIVGCVDPICTSVPTKNGSHANVHGVVPHSICNAPALVQKRRLQSQTMPPLLRFDDTRVDD